MSDDVGVFKRQTVVKRKRSNNFAERDKNLLLRLVGGHIEVIESKKTDNTTIFIKNKAWHSVQQEFNQKADVKRDQTQLRELWKRLKVKARRDVATLYRKQKNNSVTCNNTTGEINPSLVDSTLLDSTSKKVHKMIPMEFELFGLTASDVDANWDQIEMQETEEEDINGATPASSIGYSSFDLSDHMDTTHTTQTPSTCSMPAEVAPEPIKIEPLPAEPQDQPLFGTSTPAPGSTIANGQGNIQNGYIEQTPLSLHQNIHFGSVSQDATWPRRMPPVKRSRPNFSRMSFTSRSLSRNTCNCQKMSALDKNLLRLAQEEHNAKLQLVSKQMENEQNKAQLLLAQTESERLRQLILKDELTSKRINFNI